MDCPQASLRHHQDFCPTVWPPAAAAAKSATTTRSQCVRGERRGGQFPFTARNQLAGSKSFSLDLTLDSSSLAICWDRSVT
jgi:hypothetical protein